MKTRRTFHRMCLARMRYRVKARFVSLVLPALILALTGDMLRAQQVDTNVQRRLSVDLSDGSEILVTPSISSVVVRTSYAKLDVPLDRIASVKVLGEDGKVRIELSNGDSLTGQWEMTAFSGSTVFGGVTCRVEHVLGFRVHEKDDAIYAFVRRGLVLHFTFDREDGDKVTDHSDQGNHGEIHGALRIRRGSGQALSFNGIDQYVDVVSGSGLHSVTGFSVAAWVDPRAVDGRYHGILEVMSLIPSEGYMLWLRNNDRFGFYMHSLDANRSSYLDADDAATPNRWTHVVGVWDGARMHLFTDGVRQSNSVDMPNVTYGGQRRVSVGRYHVHYFNGLIDEVKAWNRALSSDEIGRLHRCEASYFGRRD